MKRFLSFCKFFFISNQLLFLISKKIFKKVSSKDFWSFKIILFLNIFFTIYNNGKDSNDRVYKIFEMKGEFLCFRKMKNKEERY